ncbi:MAG: pyridoxal-phosphate dependent enzyme [Thermoleophilaceae bacterium]|nr:pyridoxal-phosphate dependent enzyme [Thermoleophilaceae bacterium]
MNPRERLAALPRVRLCDLPTPVREEPGFGIWVKDDSRSAPLWGGNKPRKLEWILADAARRGKRSILTFGGLGTNHGLATALYARERGMKCVLALVEQPRDEHVEAQLERIAQSGARVYLTRDAVRTALAFPWIYARGGRPYVLPPGGSSPVGALGFVQAAIELGAQVDAGELPVPRAIVVALGSGGTAAGLAAGLTLAGLRDTRVVAVLVNDKLKLTEASVTRLARRSLKLLGSPDSPLAPIKVVTGFMGPGYGHATPEAARAIAEAAGAGLALDPVYTGKAMAALRAGAAGAGPVLFWNTQSA